MLVWLSRGPQPRQGADQRRHRRSESTTAGHRTGRCGRAVFRPFPIASTSPNRFGSSTSTSPYATTASITASHPAPSSAARSRTARPRLPTWTVAHRSARISEPLTWRRDRHACLGERTRTAITHATYNGSWVTPTPSTCRNMANQHDQGPCGLSRSLPRRIHHTPDPTAESRSSPEAHHSRFQWRLRVFGGWGGLRVPE